MINISRMRTMNGWCYDESGEEIILKEEAFLDGPNDSPYFHAIGFYPTHIDEDGWFEAVELVWYPNDKVNDPDEDDWSVMVDDWETPDEIHRNFGSICPEDGRFC